MFSKGGKYDEFEVYCQAFRFGWKLWPDYWIGLNMILDDIAEKFSAEDVARLDVETIGTVKEIAITTSWPNNPVVGRSMMTGAAKTVLDRYSRSAVSRRNFSSVAISPAEAATIVLSRPVAVFHSNGTIGVERLTLSPPSQSTMPNKEMSFNFVCSAGAVFGKHFGISSCPTGTGMRRGTAPPAQLGLWRGRILLGLRRMRT